MLSNLSCVLSIVGSCLIIFLTYTRGLGRDTLNQFLLGLSISDIIASLALLASPYTVPQGSLDNVVSARGNQATCSASAFSYAVAALANAFYNCWISMHFLAFARNKHKQGSSTTMQKRTRLVQHTIAVVVPLLVASTALATNAFHPHEFLDMCFYGEYPTACSKDPSVPCIHTGGKTLGRIHTLIIAVLAIISISCTLAVVRIVKARYARCQRYAIPDPTSDDGPIAPARPTLLRTSSRNSESQSFRDGAERQKAVASQAWWYMIAYLNSFLIPVIALVVLNVDPIRVIENEGSAPYYTLKIMLTVFMPLQGALNFVVFIRPRYNAWKAILLETDPNMPPSWWTILGKAIVQDVPSPREQRMRRRMQSLASLPTNYMYSSAGQRVADEAVVHSSSQSQTANLSPACSQSKPVVSFDPATVTTSELPPLPLVPIEPTSNLQGKEEDSATMSESATDREAYEIDHR